MIVRDLISLLSYLPASLPVVVLSDDGVEELPFRRGAPIVERLNVGTPDEFVAINVVVPE